MGFDRLVWNCFVQGTSHDDDRVGVTLEPSGDERALFFKTDSQGGRFALGLGGNDVASDFALFYRKGSERPIVLLIELKGSDLRHAIKQLNSVYRSVAGLFPKNCDKRPVPEVRSLVVLSGSVPSDYAKIMPTADGLNLRVKSGVKRGKVNLKEFLKPA